ncbi:sigma-70 family RNA polymerase sigma factor [Nonomuraea sp. JJY05]|uniref:sigma-70 family RNA polymerase sigma factor n=1 Tax=Nonomuraea sp. JJY05 TaxID=3350255 RepID=UPI00373F4A18
MAVTDLEQAVAVFAGVRPRLFGIAYRMLASATEAEDLVQDVWLRWQAYDRATVNDPAAFLATTTTRLAINATQSARARRETYVGPWLPEPVDTGADPYLGAERGEALEFAVLLLLERLTPTERAAYVLREAFDYPYRQIADIIELNEPAVRQLVSRARKRVLVERRTPVTRTEQRRLLIAFVAAARSGDMTALEELFAADVISYSDGVVRASRLPMAFTDRLCPSGRGPDRFTQCPPVRSPTAFTPRSVATIVAPPCRSVRRPAAAEHPFQLRRRFSAAVSTRGPGSGRPRRRRRCWAAGAGRPP